MQVTDAMVAKAAEVAYLRNRAGDTPWDALSPQHKSEWREKVRPVITAALAEMWRPVEEAPDNEVVLVCGLGASGYYVADAKKVDGGWMLFSCENDEYSMGSSGHTHFMPLPARPKDL